MKQITIALVDGFDDGHHLTHLRNYARALLEMGHRVVELLPDPNRVDAWFSQECAGHQDRLLLHPFRHAEHSAPLWRLRRIWPPLARWREAARAVADAEQRSGWHVDLVFFCWLDYYVVGLSPVCRFAIPWLFARAWSGLFFHPWHLRSRDGDPDSHYGVSTGILRTRHCRGVAVLDEGVVGRLRQLLGRAVICFPDETDETLPDSDPTCVAYLRKVACGRKVIGLVGELSRRKGVIAFLEAAAHARNRNWLFLMAGALGETQRRTYSAEDWPRVESVLNNPPPNLLVLPERVENEADFNAIVRMCDVLFAAYETFGHSSGLVTKAAVFQKPILVSPGYCMAERVTRYRIGLTAEPRDTAAVVAALACLLDEESLVSRLGSPDFEGCHQAHAAHALRTALEELLAHV